MFTFSNKVDEASKYSFNDVIEALRYFRETVGEFEEWLDKQIDVIEKKGETIKVNPYRSIVSNFNEVAEALGGIKNITNNYYK